ncbi:MAG TPA: P27 family phage terminase small subunit [Vicinamibacterales bacterium]|nr:P27 family phage terminase small subunit [Vicinamibacterales bacterium]
MPGTSNSGGHNKKSTHLHVLQGTFRPSRHGDHTTPEPPAGRPRPPRPLVGTARAEWDRMVERLEQAGTLSLVDDAALYQYVQLFAETEELREECSELRRDQRELRRLTLELRRTAGALRGRELQRAIGEIVKLQLALSDLRRLRASVTTKIRQGRMALRQYLVEFGMTPSARGRVKLPKPATPAIDPVRARFFGAGGPSCGDPQRA